MRAKNLPKTVADVRANRGLRLRPNIPCRARRVNAPLVSDEVFNIFPDLSDFLDTGQVGAPGVLRDVELDVLGWRTERGETMVESPPRAGDQRLRPAPRRAPGGGQRARAGDAAR